MVRVNICMNQLKVHVTHCMTCSCYTSKRFITEVLLVRYNLLRQCLLMDLVTFNCMFSNENKLLCVHVWIILWTNIGLSFNSQSPV